MLQTTADIHTRDQESYLQVQNNLAAETFLSVAEIAPFVYWFGDPILRKVCTPIDFEAEFDELERVANRLSKTLLYVRQKLGLGRGLAAPQIGISKRVFVALVGDEIEVLVNPKITSFSKSRSSYPEMCLSGIPLAADVVRPQEIEVEYHDINGELQTIRPEPILSRIIQHEIDHLDGIIFVDRADPKSCRFVFDFDDFKRTSKLIEID